MEKETPWVVPEDGELDFGGCEVRQMRLPTFSPGWVNWGNLEMLDIATCTCSNLAVSNLALVSWRGF